MQFRRSCLACRLRHQKITRVGQIQKYGVKRGFSRCWVIKHGAAAFLQPGPKPERDIFCKPKRRESFAIRTSTASRVFLEEDSPASGFVPLILARKFLFFVRMTFFLHTGKPANDHPAPAIDSNPLPATRPQTHTSAFDRLAWWLRQTG